MPSQGYYDLMDRVTEQGPANPFDYEGVPGFFTSLAAGAGQTWREDLSISSLTQDEDHGAVVRQLHELRRNGDIPAEIWRAHSKPYPDWMDQGPTDNMDYEGLAQYARSKGVEIELPSELNARMRESLKQKRDAATAVQERAGFTGKVGSFLGSMGTAFIDPVNLATMGAGSISVAAEGVSVLQKLATVGGINLATEAILQPSVMAWKERIDSPYGAKDALANMAMAFGTGVAFEGLSQGIQAFVKRARAAHLDVTPEGKEAVTAVEQAGKELQQIQQHAPEGTTPDAGVTRVDSAMKDMADKGPVRTPDIQGPDPGTHPVDAALEADYNAAISSSNGELRIHDTEQGMQKATDVIGGLEEKTAALKALRGCIGG